MKPPKEYYSTYLADNELSDLNINLAHEVLKQNPNHVFEMGCGTGKNLKLIEKLQSQYARSGVSLLGIDVSFLNIIHAHVKNGLSGIMIGDENYLRNMANIDVVFTVSVLDHIPDISGIIQEFQRIANKAVFLAECIEADEQKYYYSHKFENYGFKKIEGSDYFSDADRHNYAIWKWEKGKEALPLSKFVNNAHDDFAQ